MRTENRRSFLQRVLGGSAVAGGALVLSLEPAWATREAVDTDPNDTNQGARPVPGWTNINDRDPKDHTGRGRGTGHTDQDSADRPCVGRGRARNGVTDRDRGDRTGNGRGRGRSDQDPNDRACNGRGSTRRN